MGIKTDSADSEGKVIEEVSVSNEIWDQEKIKEILNSFLGEQEQIPPIYSAIKVNGKKLYEYARKGQKVEIKPRTIKIYSIELLEIKPEGNKIRFEVSCSKGTYVRSLCEDIASRLGTIGYMSALERTKVGEFLIKDAILVEEFKENIGNIDWLNKYFISIEKFFEDREEIELDKRKLELFLNGVKLTYEKENDCYRVYNEGEFIGIGTIENNLLKRDIIL